MTPDDFKTIVIGLIEDSVIYLNETNQSTDLPIGVWVAGLIPDLEVLGEE